MSDRLPLKGIRVLDLGTLLAGPFARRCGDFGARVIRNRTRTGDTLRGTPRDGKAARPIRWLVDARNKKSVTLNLRVSEGQALLRELVSHVDVVIENLTPGTLERWHLGWDDLSAANPGLIMVRVSGYGQTGPYAKRPDETVLPWGSRGYMQIHRFPIATGASGVPTADYNTATFGAFAAMLALYERDANGGKAK